jgi:hypothetical protein
MARAVGAPHLYWIALMLSHVLNGLFEIWDLSRWQTTQLQNAWIFTPASIESKH